MYLKDNLQDVTPNNKKYHLLDGQIEESVLYIKRLVKLLKKVTKKKSKIERKITFVGDIF